MTPSESTGCMYALQTSTGESVTMMPRIVQATHAAKR